MWLSTRNVSWALGFLAVAAACGEVDRDSEGRLGTSRQALCTGVALSGSPAGPVLVGTDVTLTASEVQCAAGEAPEYKFTVKRVGSSAGYALLRDYAEESSLVWGTSGLDSGKYDVVVHTRALGGSGGSEDAAHFTLLVGDVCTEATLEATPDSPQPLGTSVSLSASAACTGSATPEFRYLARLQGAGDFTEIAPYSPDAAVEWSTAGLSDGVYNLLVQVRAAGNTSNWEGRSYGKYLLGGVCDQVALDFQPDSPQPQGTTVALLANASCHEGAEAEYKFLHRAPGATAYSVLRDYAADPQLDWWTGSVATGTHRFLVYARSAGSVAPRESLVYGSFDVDRPSMELVANASRTCVLFDGRLRCFGADLLGAPTGQYSHDRGIEATDMGDNLPAVDLGAGLTAKRVSTGAYHACAILEDDSVKCWGENGAGALGLGDTVHRTAANGGLGDSLPRVSLGSGRTAKAISAGQGFTCAILDDDTVKCWGANSFGQLGLGDTEHRGDDPDEMGDALPAVDLGSGRTARQVHASFGHACALLDNYQIKCWGLNTYGELGLGDRERRGDEPGEMGDSLPSVELGTGRSARVLALGSYQTCARLDNRELKCWGFNRSGQLGLGDTENRGDGPDEMGDALPAVDLGTGRWARRIRAGGHHTCALLDDHTVKCWGYNYDAQLGVGDTANRGDEPDEMGDGLPSVDLGPGRRAYKLLATQINTCAKLDGHEIKCWGPSWSGMLGVGASDTRGDEATDMGEQLRGFRLGTHARIRELAGGHPYHYGCALLQCGQVKCWGANSFGQLGIGRSSNVGDEPGDLGDGLRDVALGPHDVVAVGTGQAHSCALLDNGAVKCWGANRYGTLGQGDTARRGGRDAYMGSNLPEVPLGTGVRAVALAVGTNHSCALLDDQRVKCWGNNSDGQLGLGDTEHRGDDEGEMGDALPAVDLGDGPAPKALALGDRHSCAVLDDDSLVCWGWNTYGQLGLGDRQNRGDDPGEMGDALPRVDLGAGAKVLGVRAGSFHTCALLNGGKLKCWGNNAYGQLGLEDTTYRGNAPGGMGDALPPVDFGLGRSVAQFSVGASHSCAVLDDASLKCWGRGAGGRLGYGDSMDRGGVAGQMGDALPTVDFGGLSVSAVASGAQHNCALLSDGTIRCWGSGGAGELGRGDNRSVGGSQGDMGAGLAPVDMGW